METLVTQVIGLSGNNTRQGDLEQLNTYLKGQESYLSNHQPAIQQALHALDATAHSLGVLYLLDARCKGNALVAYSDAGSIDYVANFLKVATAAQVQLEPAMFCRVARRFKDQVVEAACPRKGIMPLMSAVRLLQPSSECLTPLHAECFQLCLLAKVYNAALPLLEADICSIDPPRTALVPADLLLYCYYGGLLAIGRKQYTRALELLLQCLTVPTVMASAITVAAYKKYVLVSLIHTGALAPLPKFTPSKVRQVVEIECRHYNELAAAYASHSSERLRKLSEQHAQVFAHDTNVGLVKLVSKSLTKRTIQHLTQTYLTLSAADIALQVGLPSAADAEAHILRMVEAGEIYAQISQRDGMVRFLEDPEQYCSAATAARVDTDIRRCVQLAEKLSRVLEAVLCDKQYLSKVSSKERTRFEVGDDYGAGGSLYQP